LDDISYLFVTYACSLVRPANLDQLVNYVLQTPADEENEKIKYKLVLCSLNVHCDNTQNVLLEDGFVQFSSYFLCFDTISPHIFFRRPLAKIVRIESGPVETEVICLVSFGL